MRDARYIEIPGSKTHELPPLLVHSAPEVASGTAAELASVMSEAEDMLAVSDDRCEVTHLCVRAGSAARRISLDG